jgi:hypothetical protein
MTIKTRQIIGDELGLGAEYTGALTANGLHPRYIVDGHTFDDEESDLTGDGQFPPFRIFMPDEQDYLPGTYPTREAAQAEADRLNAPVSRT